MDVNDLLRLARVIDNVRGQGRSLSPLVSLRLGILSNSTTDFIAPALVAAAARHGVALECVSPDYGQVIQEALSPDSLINTSNLDAVLIAIDHRAFPISCKTGDVKDAIRAVDMSAAFIQSIRTGIATIPKLFVYYRL